MLTTISALAFAVGAGAQMSSVPFFMWSPEQYFTRAKCTEWEVGEVLDMEDVAGGLRRLGKVGQQNGSPQLSKYFADTTPFNRPELVVAFVYSELGSSTASQQAGAFATTPESGALGYLQHALGDAQSCVSVPYLRAPQGQSVSDLMSTSLTTASKGTQLSFKLGGEGASSCDAILAKVHAEPALLNNGVTDLLMLRADHPADMDAGCMERILTDLGKATQKNMVAVLTADAAKPLTLDFETTESRNQRRLLALHDRKLTAETVVLPPVVLTIQYITAPILAGLMLVLLLLIFLWIGVSCLMSIDTPARFASEPLPVPKEY